MSELETLYPDIPLILWDTSKMCMVSETQEPSNSLCDKTVHFFRACYLLSYTNLDVQADISVPHSNTSFILKIDFLGPAHYFQDILKYSWIYPFFFSGRQASCIYVQWHRTVNWSCQFRTCSSIRLLAIQSLHKHNLICKLYNRKQNHNWMETKVKIGGLWVIQRKEK